MFMLCIGGKFDGEYIQREGNMFEYASLPILSDSPITIVKRCRYYVYPIRGPNHANYDVWRHEDINELDLFPLLLKGYAKGAKK